VESFNPHTDKADIIWHVEYVQNDSPTPCAMDLVTSKDESSLVKIAERVALLRRYPPGTVSIITAYIKSFVR